MTARNSHIRNCPKSKLPCGIAKYAASLVLFGQFGGNLSPSLGLYSILAWESGCRGESCLWLLARSSSSPSLLPSVSQLQPIALAPVGNRQTCSFVFPSFPSLSSHTQASSFPRITQLPDLFPPSTSRYLIVPLPSNHTHPSQWPPPVSLLPAWLRPWPPRLPALPCVLSGPPLPPSAPSPVCENFLIELNASVASIESSMHLN